MNDQLLEDQYSDDRGIRLHVSNLSKRFGSATVLDSVSLDVRAGQLHGLIGQNGAGKSTFVKTLAGLYPDHGGTVSIDGKPVELRTPRRSRAQGVAVIFQEFSLVPSMTVAENLLLGQEPGSWRYSARGTHDAAAELLERESIDVGAPLDAMVADQSPGVMQRIEIAKALGQDARVLVMDEPTTRLSEAERHWLFRTMREVCDRGVGVMFISHFLEEVLGITDWLTVLRNGKVVGSAPTERFSVTQMTELMLGEELKLESERQRSQPTDERPVTISLDRVNLGPRLRNVSVELRAGEVLGVAGLVGSGRTRLCRVISGADRPTSGCIRLKGKEVKFRNPRDAIANGIALIPEDRKHQGLSMTGSIGDNLCLMSLQRRHGPLAVVTRSSVRKQGEALVKELQIVPPTVNAPVSTLSGGNQQKVVLGKALAADPEILIIDQPTAGVDVGTKAQIYRILRDRAKAGATILVVSDDLDELYALSDRLCVLRKGEVLWQGTPLDLNKSELLQLISAGAIQPENGERSEAR
jgi:ribose transport system ATP-binding protein